VTIRWRGRGEPQEQVANACDSFVDLTPVSEAAAVATRSKWSALLPGQTIPLIWEDTRGYRGQEDEPC
jgi:hypothetical protein